ncbi:hypothetical protein CR513_53496, partial [Mucuna pruriens]
MKSTRIIAFWHKIWSPNMHPRNSCFLWKVGDGRLMVNVFRRNHGSSDNCLCPICQQKDENILHVGSFLNNWVKDGWLLSYLRNLGSPNMITSKLYGVLSALKIAWNA